MPTWGRYAVTVYVGLLMAGALGRPPMAARSASQHDGGSGLSAKLAPLKAPYRYTEKQEQHSAVSSTDRRRATLDMDSPHEPRPTAR